LGLLASFAATLPVAGQPTPAASVAAPVPAVVAMDRISNEQVSLLNDSLKKMLIKQDASLKDVFDQHPRFALLSPPRANTAIIPALNNPGFQAKHAAYVELAKKGDIDLLFMGDSITDFWRNPPKDGQPFTAMAGKAVLDKYWGNVKLANFGIAGDFTQGVLYRLQNGEGQGFQPKAIMLMIGTNNTAANTGPEIAEGVGAIVLEMRKDFPAAKILLLAIFPRDNPGDPKRAINTEANKIIAKLDDGKNVFFMDIGDKFLSPDGTIAPDIMADKLHPTDKGYEIWAAAVKDKLAELMK
jgi:lysophospholipase L1-like esterase